MIRRTVKATERRKRALARLESQLTGVRKATQADYHTVASMGELTPDFKERFPYCDRHRFYTEKSKERIQKEIETLKSRI